MKTLNAAMDAATDVDDVIGNARPDGDNETSEALAERNPTDMDGVADWPVNMTASRTSVERGFSRVADPEVSDAGIDSTEQRQGGRLDGGGFLGRPFGFAR